MSENPDRRAAFLREMGLGPLWQARHPPQEADTHGEPVASESLSVPEPIPEPAFELTLAPAAANPTGTAGIAAPPASDVAGMNWIELKSNVAACVKCGLCESRTRTVFGVGDEKAKWMFIGEGPGYNEDRHGEPFIGQAGKLLDNMLLAMNLKRGENVYIANVVKCRPTDEAGRDRPPSAEESAACMPYLARQIELIQPDVLVALGKSAALALLGLPPSTPVSKLRGKVHHHADRPLIVTYHPAYLLRNLVDKRKAWEDLCLAMTTYANIG